MGVRFIPAQDFSAEVNGYVNNYHKGAIYTVHDTPAHRDLAKKVQSWWQAGRVVIVGNTDGRSSPGSISSR